MWNDGLTERQTRFVIEMVRDPTNQRAAALAAGYSEISATQMAVENLSKPHVVKAIAEYSEIVTISKGATPEFVLSKWIEIAGADPNELVSVRRTCCRHCHGYGHAYQWTPAEYMRAVDLATRNDQPAPMPDGGLDFDATRDPDPGCPECRGEGIEDVRVSDTRKVTRRGKALYAGAERTRNGVKINMHDQKWALDNLAGYLGMQVKRTEISGPDGRPIGIAHLRAEDLSDEQLLAVLAEPDDDGGNT